MKNEMVRCSVPVAPLRVDKSDSSEMISQVLFGELMELLEVDNNWSKVRCAWDDYTGWIDTKQYKSALNLETWNKIDVTGFDSKSHLLLSLGSFVQEKTEQKEYSLELFLDLAKSYIGTSYLWGGRSAFGIDCSGLSQQLMSFLNISVPRDAYMQVEHGNTVSFVEECKGGELAFFGTEEKINHVGIVLPNTEILHAHGCVRIDKLDSTGIYNQEKAYYSHPLRTIKRLKNW